MHPRRADHTKQGRSNPDAMVRWSPADVGTITEFKTLDPGEDASDTTLRAAIGRGSKQLRATAGCLVIDTRGTALAETQARRGHARAVGHARVHGKTLPGRIIVILPSNAMIDLSRGE